MKTMIIDLIYATTAMLVVAKIIALVYQQTVFPKNTTILKQDDELEI